MLCNAEPLRHVFSFSDAIDRSFEAILRNSLKMSVPAGIYFAQNFMQYVGLTNLDSGTFSVLSQMKILSAALFSVAMLGRVLSWRKWRGLTTLIVGVILIIRSAMDADEKSSSLEDPDKPRGNLYLGLTAVSAVSGVGAVRGASVSSVCGTACVDVHADACEVDVAGYMSVLLVVVNVGCMSVCVGGCI